MEQLELSLNIRIKDAESIEEPEGTPYSSQEISAWNRELEDCSTQQPYDKYRRKLSEEIIDDKRKKYIYESPDGGKTIYRREFGKSDREVVENFQRTINENKNFMENPNTDSRSGNYEDEMEMSKNRESWVCSICGKNTYDVEWDYLGSGTNHLGCELEIEMKTNKDWKGKGKKTKNKNIH